MALIPCKDCKKEFSTDALRCPNCGARKPALKLNGIRLLKLFFICTIVFVAFALLTGKEPSYSEPVKKLSDYPLTTSPQDAYSQCYVKSLRNGDDISTRTHKCDELASAWCNEMHYPYSKEYFRLLATSEGTAPDFRCFNLIFGESAKIVRMHGSEAQKNAVLGRERKPFIRIGTDRENDPDRDYRYESLQLYNQCISHSLRQGISPEETTSNCINIGIAWCINSGIKMDFRTGDNSRCVAMLVSQYQGLQEFYIKSQMPSLPFVPY